MVTSWVCHGQCRSGTSRNPSYRDRIKEAHLFLNVYSLLSVEQTTVSFSNFRESVLIGTAPNDDLVSNVQTPRVVNAILCPLINMILCRSKAFEQSV